MTMLVGWIKINPVLIGWPITKLQNNSNIISQSNTSKHIPCKMDLTVTILAFMFNTFTIVYLNHLKFNTENGMLAPQSRSEKAECFQW